MSRFQPPTIAGPPALGSWPLALALALMLCVPAVGQEVYELDEQYQWQQQTNFDPATPEGQLQAIRKTLAEGRAKGAVELADAWIEQYPNHPQLVEAYLVRGDAKVAQGAYYKALFDYEYLIVSFPAAEQYLTALEREYEIARLFASGTKRKVWGMRMMAAAGEAEELFIRCQERAPGSDVGERASLALAEFYYDRAEMTAAAEAYDLFLVNYPRTRFREQAMLRVIGASFATFKGPRFDPRGLINASERIRAFEQEFPAAAEQMDARAMLSRIDESLALKVFYSAGWYDRTAQRVSAVYLYRRVVQDYPQTNSAQAAIRRLEELGEPIVGDPLDTNDSPKRQEQMLELMDSLESPPPGQQEQN